MVKIRGSIRVRQARECIGEKGLEPILRLNPADYTAWELARELGEDDWDTADEACRAFPKNYQVWYHRRAILNKKLSSEESRTSSTGTASLGTRELDFLDALLEDPENAKNYHLYSHRQWLIRQPQLVSEALLWREWNLSTQRELERDPLNNSAWQHRWAVLTELRRRGCFQTDCDLFAEQLAERVTWSPVPEYLQACRKLLRTAESQRPQSSAAETRDPR
jgi:protein farnesyltransferase/geranylgeranyltransferase type-1 subunit alpha